MENDKTINYDNGYSVVMANKLIKGMTAMSLQESKLLYIVISQIVFQDKDLKTYTTTIPALAEFMGVAPSNLYQSIKPLCRSLKQRVVDVQIDKNKWKVFSWIDKAEYDNGKLSLKLSEDIKPYVLELKKHYSQFLLDTLMQFQSFHASRIFQILVSEMQGKYEIDVTWTVSEIRNNLKINDNQYKQTRDLIKKTIEVAKNEINSVEDCHIFMSYTINKARKKGNPIESVTIHAESKCSKPIPEGDLTEIDDMLQYTFPVLS